MSQAQFYNLTPDQVMSTLEHCGYEPTGQYIQLNSYENRVYDIRLETNPDHSSIVTKFYRPGRWAAPTILEEHEFAQDLNSGGLSAIAPLVMKKPTTSNILSYGSTLNSWNNILFTVFPKAKGRMIDELKMEDYQRLGRTLARLHNIGSEKKFKSRPKMEMNTYGWDNLELIQKNMPQELVAKYAQPASTIIEFLEDHLDPKKFIRIHGDCHRGNILKTDPKDAEPEYFFVDFDDCMMGPPVQDLWMLLSAPDHTDEADEELEALFKGYNQFRKMDMDDMDIIPALRGLRIIYYSAWIARRWEDPTFPKLFPSFTEQNYWFSEIEALNEIASYLK
jgi:Ser/Thr protein kinase RdoA (MazF antagonist)